jgi:hypothetical protein
LVVGSSVWAGLPIFVASYIIISSMGFFSFLFCRKVTLKDDFLVASLWIQQGITAPRIAITPSKSCFIPLNPQLSA